MSEFARLTPVNLLTGFLGSGKTTLLKRLLSDPALADAAVLINEFGEIGLDHHLVERIDETMVLLQSGCLCCTVRGELAEALRDLHSKRERGLPIPFRCSRRSSRTRSSGIIFGRATSSLRWTQSMAQGSSIPTSNPIGR
jgi:hypothetical protein